MDLLVEPDPTPAPTPAPVAPAPTPAPAPAVPDFPNLQDLIAGDQIQQDTSSNAPVMDPNTGEPIQVNPTFSPDMLEILTNGIRSQDFHDWLNNVLNPPAQGPVNPTPAPPPSAPPTQLPTPNPIPVPPVSGVYSETQPEEWRRYGRDGGEVMHYSNPNMPTGGYGGGYGGGLTPSAGYVSGQLDGLLQQLF